MGLNRESEREMERDVRENHDLYEALADESREEDDE